MQDITGLVLAGGRGSRMGGADKGLQAFRGAPLALHALERLRPQVSAVALNANRHLGAYAAFGAPVWQDADPGEYAGPLAGFLAGLTHCATPWLLTVPCDTPLFPHDLAARLARAAAQAQAPIALAATAQRPQPVFCLMQTALLPDLRRFMNEGDRKVSQWAARRDHATAAFDAPGDDPRAFDNANTLAELHALEGG